MKRTLKEYNKELSDTYDKYITLRNCGNADQLTDEDGSFKPTVSRKDGVISIGYLEEACQWAFYHKDLSYIKKMEKILALEEIIQHFLGGINYVPYWSHKLTLSYKIDI